MTVLFLDTSAISKRNITEVGSGWMIAQTQPISGNMLAISELTIAEHASVLTRKRRMGALTATDINTLYANFMAHVQMEYTVVSLDAAITLRAVGLLFTHPLRTLDAIQLSAALQLSIDIANPVTFISADNNLLRAAQTEGFQVDNPLNHP